jgi:glycosyltransferase involved in cell wall biosynthesis
LVNGLLGSSEAVLAYREAFAADPELVLAGPRDYYLDGPVHEGACKKALALQHGPLPENYGFFAGTMFWCRPSAFLELSELYPQTCFMAHADADGQPEHVVERAFGTIAALNNKNILLWDGGVELGKASELNGATDFQSVYLRDAEVSAGEGTTDTDLSERPTLYQLHKEHRGFVSDKWTGNLIQYERLLRDFRDHEVRLLEIGVQNGGSLQIWSKFFENGCRFIGCDIDPSCGELVYDDPRISLLINDAGAPVTRTQAMRICGQFDLIIDDGSHQSSDIIRAFLSFFPTLANDGLFIVEDMSCSFWKEFEGGLDCDISSLAFFKEVANVINREHWQVEASIASRFKRFIEAYGLDFDAYVLDSIQSVEILNSMVVIRKGSQEQTELGRRMVHGTEARITTAVQQIHGTYCIPPGVTRGASDPLGADDNKREDIAISVVIPFYNGSAYLRDAVESVKAQTLPAREIIVVNDGSNEAETRWIEDFASGEDLILISQKNMGQGGARNTGARAARGTHLCFLDQDDMFRPTHNEALVDHWRNCSATMKDLGWVFADVAQMDPAGVITAERIFPYATNPVLLKPSEFISRDAIMFPSAAMICRERFFRAGGFDAAFRGYEDDDLFLRMLLTGSTTSYLPVTVTQWRLHPTQTSNQSVFLQSAEHFFEKWFGYDWGDLDECALADARLKARLSSSLETHLRNAPQERHPQIWRIFNQVQEARSVARMGASSDDMEISQ